MSADWSRESFQDGGELAHEDTRSATVAVSDWTAGGLRWEWRVRADRWQKRPLRLGAGASVEQRLLRDHLALRAAFDVWPASEIAATAAGARWRTSSERPLQVSGAFNVGVASADAPRAIWMGAGTGLGRPWLLRAHPMLDDGVIDEGGLGRQVTQASVEVRRSVARLGLLHVDFAAFLDAADIGESGQPTRAQADAGAGIRVRIAGEGTVRIDIARGLRDGATALSLGWELPWPAWP